MLKITNIFPPAPFALLLLLSTGGCLRQDSQHPHWLGNGKYHTVANGTFVSGADVYVAGEERHLAALWKNGKLIQRLGNKNRRAVASSVFVSANDIYVAGSELNAKGYWIATVWKNGRALYRLNEGSHAFSESLAVSGADVYVAGYEETRDGVCESEATGRMAAWVWKNGQAYQRVGDGINSAVARSLAIAGDDIYVAGHEWNELGNCVATVWKNGDTQYSLGAPHYNSYANSIFVSGNDVYAAGTEMNAQGVWMGTVWKNGLAQQALNGHYGLGTENPDSHANALLVAHEDVYVAGTVVDALGSQAAFLWKNGLAHHLNHENYNAGARALFLSGEHLHVAGFERKPQGRPVAAVWKVAFEKMPG